METYFKQQQKKQLSRTHVNMKEASSSSHNTTEKILLDIEIKILNIINKDHSPHQQHWKQKLMHDPLVINIPHHYMITIVIHILEMNYRLDVLFTFNKMSNQGILRTIFDPPLALTIILAPKEITTTKAMTLSKSYLHINRS